ncbi:hypothetical protein Tco_0728098 [Tanacetum coccineum]|uniref:Uncharacterized protein n=1 Tax=Tanacetum coccineum TaxID=301880 RepID=A0ABQ4YMS2_9ASTR
MVLVPKLVTKIANLEKELHQTKTTYGKAVLTLVKKVQSLEVSLKKKTKKVVVSDSEDKETENQGRKIQDIDDDPLGFFWSEEKWNWDTSEQNLKQMQNDQVSQGEAKTGASQLTQAQQRDYMSTFIKNQSSWKFTQLKKLTFDELKTEFEKLVKGIENFMPIWELGERVVKREVNQEGSNIARGNRNHIGTRSAQDESEEEREAFMKDKVTSTSSESEIGIDAIPTATKPPSIVDWKIIPQSGLKAVYQIIRKDGSDKIYMSFGAILKDFSRDDLTELYRLVIKNVGNYTFLT